MIPGKLIGIDHGLKRIGVATSDASGIVARELTIIHRTSKAEDFAKLQQIAQEQRAAAFVIGVPHNEDDDSPYSQANKVRRWVGYFAKTTDLTIILWDEQLTSQDARDLAYEKGRPPTDATDDLAARLILQSYLDALHDGLATFPQRPES
jgi:putative Holliday junction resolvase